MGKVKWSALVLAPALVLTFLLAQTAASPSPAKQGEDKQATKNEQPENVEVYRVDYKISQRENGKTINSRSYTLMARTGSRASTRIGSRLPYRYGENNYQYQDLGTKIDCVVKKQQRNLLVETGITLDTVEDKERSASSVSPPVLRHLSLEDITVATLGRPVFVGSIDDVASNQRYVIEVTVTKAD